MKGEFKELIRAKIYTLLALNKPRLFLPTGEGAPQRFEGLGSWIGGGQGETFPLQYDSVMVLIFCMQLHASA